MITEAARIIVQHCSHSRAANNLEGKYKRAVGMALVITMGNFGGAIASNIFRTQDAPRYLLGCAWTNLHFHIYSKLTNFHSRHGNHVYSDRNARDSHLDANVYAVERSYG